MSPDPFEQLRLDGEPDRPDPRFTARLRQRVAVALADPPPDVPTIDLPERTTTMTDTATTETGTAASTVTTSVIPYICVSPAVDAIAWYTDVLGAVETIRYAADDGRVGHAEMSFAGATVMLSDEYPELGVVSPTSLGGTSGTLHLTVPDVDAVHARAVERGGQVAGEPRDEAYGARAFSMVDPFGHRWMVQTPIAVPTVEEIQAASPGFTITTPDVAPASPTAAPVELGYVTFAVPDTIAARRFYGELFGWATEPGNVGDEYAHVNNTKLPLGIVPGPVDEAPVLYFKVDDVAAYSARVPALGGEVLSQTRYPSGPNIVCRDDQGREFQLWQPAPGYE